jgi:hypothetical protein
MAFKRNLYPKGTSSKMLRDLKGTGISEIDLRKEFDNIVFGGPTSLAHGRQLLLRKMRRDANNELLVCTCTSSFTGEPDTERSCPFCFGEGFYWDEIWATGYGVYVGADGGNANRVRGLKPGSVRADYRIFYMRYDTSISYRDKIIDLKLDTEGGAVVPYARESIYKPQTINRYRSDNGRVEYIAAYCREDDAIRIDE